MSREEKINKNRTYWHEKAYAQLSELLMLSLDRHSKQHEQALHELETTIQIIWRFDGKLKRHRESYDTEEV